jgi:hypothetical protein
MIRLPLLGEPPRALPLWQRAMLARNRGARARIALWQILQQCGCYEVTLPVVHLWSRELQGAAYVWALDRLDGLQRGPAPWLASIAETTPAGEARKSSAK